MKIHNQGNDSIELKFDEQIWDIFGMVSLREAGSEDDIKCLTIKEDALHDTLVINPYIPLKPPTNYTLTYHTGDLDGFVSFKDTSGNECVPIELKY